MVFLIVFSYCVASAKTEKLPVFGSSVETLEEAKSTVMGIAGATIAMSVVITFLPDDYATPLADSLADMNKYFIMMLGMIMFEKLLVIKGVPLVFRFVIPLAIILLLAYMFTKRELLKTLAIKIFSLALVLILVVPCGTGLSNKICSEYMSYVEETVSLAEDGAEKVEGISDSTSDKGFFEKVSVAFQSAIDGVKDLFDYYKGIIQRFIVSIVILLIAYCVIPVLTFALLLWILNQLFQFSSFKTRIRGGCDE
jgi:hypothetical protein